MTVKELISVLGSMPDGAEVRYFWDGCARSGIAKVYESNAGNVVLSHGSERSYDESDLPKGEKLPARGEPASDPIPYEPPAAGYGGALGLPVRNK